MKPWIDRPKEEAYLLNPPFCCILVTASVVGYFSIQDKGLPFCLPFIIIPIVLHKKTREALPKRIDTYLAGWIEENQDCKLFYYEHVTSLLPYVREAILFGGIYKWLEFENNGAIITSKTEKDIEKLIKKTTDEVKDCIQKSIFVGRWLANAGSTETIMALWGVRP